MSAAFKLLDEFPPCCCRLLAVRYPVADNRRWPVALTDTEICALGSITLADVRHLSLLPNWNEVSISKMRAFTKGCRLNFGSYRALDRLRRMVNRSQFSHLKRAPHWNQLKEVLDVWDKLHAV